MEIVIDKNLDYKLLIKLEMLPCQLTEISLKFKWWYYILK